MSFLKKLIFKILNDFNVGLKFDVYSKSKKYEIKRLEYRVNLQIRCFFHGQLLYDACVNFKGQFQQNSFAPNRYSNFLHKFSPLNLLIFVYKFMKNGKYLFICM